MRRFKLKLGALNAGYSDLTRWHRSTAEDWVIFGSLPVRRSRVYTGDETFAYSHHMTVAKFLDRYVVSWSNGFRNEDNHGQSVHIAWSADLDTWTPYHRLAPTDPAERIVRNNAGVLVADSRLHVLVGVCEGRDNANVSTGTVEPEQMWLDVYSTVDLQTWEHTERLADSVYLFEAPRRTADGDLLCCGINSGKWQENLVLFWPAGREVTAGPDVSSIPVSSHGIMPEQGTWYQLDDGRILMYLRDGSYSNRLALSISEDGGRSWCEPVRTDFPNSYSRAYAGRLADGRFYIVGNNYDRFLDRSHLHIAVSDDGEVFDRMYSLLSGQTTRRIDGYHKEDGFHYPNCIEDSGKLCVAYSVNKEDIEVLCVDVDLFE